MSSDERVATAAAECDAVRTVQMQLKRQISDIILKKQ